jgi:hypothetical protein
MFTQVYIHELCDFRISWLNNLWSCDVWFYYVAMRVESDKLLRLCDAQLQLWAEKGEGKALWTVDKVQWGERPN